MNNSDLPAMPQACVNADYWKDFMIGTFGGAPCGLTKREHFAGLAMQGMVIGVVDIDYDLVAVDAVEMANALLKALES